MNLRRKPIRVLIADDNKAVRRGIRVRLEQAENILVVGEASNGVDAVAIARAERADVVLMDLQMPGMHGLEATRELVGPDSDGTVAVIVMTSHAGDGYVLSALESGAVGYLLKSQDSDQVTAAIYAAARGDALVSSHVTGPVLREVARRRGAPPDPVGLSRLSPAERKVVAALSQGMTGNDEIAQHLHLSVNTVRSQLQSAMKKSGVDDRTQLALWGARNHLDTEDL
jgi:DNA-binding NarL/FixJ family response regulator